MKTLTAPAELARTRAWGAPIHLLTLAFTVPSALTLRFATRYIVVGGVEYLPGLISPGPFVVGGLDRFGAGGRPATGQITLDNTRPVEGTTATRLSDLFKSAGNPGGFEWAGATATVSVLLDPSHGTGDVIPIGTYRLEDPDQAGETLTLTMSDLSLLLEDALRITTITRALFPACSPVVLDEPVRRPFGKRTNVPATWVVDAVLATLDGGINASQTTIPLDDARDVPASGTGFISEERVTWTGKTMTGTLTGELTGVTRGANGTTADSHDDGATLMVARTDVYRAIVGESDVGFPIKAVTNIRVNGAPARTSPTVALEATDIATGKRLAAITFTPASVNTFHLAPLGAEIVSSPTSIQIGPLNGSGSNQTGTRSIAVPVAEIAAPTTRSARLRIRKLSGTGTVTSYTLSRQLGGGGAVNEIAAGSDATLPHTQIRDTRNWNSLKNDIWTLVLDFSGATDLVVEAQFQEYSVTARGGGSGIASTAGRVIGTVTCDVEGIQDDGSGTISGTANLLLELPADIVRYIHLQLLPHVATGDLGATWAATRASQSGLGYAWALLLGPMSYSELRRQIGEQSQAALYFAGGKVEYAFLPSTPTPVLTLDYTTDLAAEPRALVRRSAATEIKNSLKVSYDRVEDSGDFGAVITRELAGLTDATRRPGTLELPWVTLAAMAEALGDYWLALWSRQRFELEAAAWRNIIFVDPADHLTVSGHPVLAGHGTVVFRVLETRDEPATGLRHLVALDVDTL